MKQNMLLLVNEQDNIIGYGAKMETHQTGKLHRAFSIFIYDKYMRKMLIQKRSIKKYHSGGLWSNACCSHPYQAENWESAVSRCMLDELGIDTIFFKSPIETGCFNDTMNHALLQYAGKFLYFSGYENLSEHEIDHVFVYIPEKPSELLLHSNKDEVEALRWVEMMDLEQELSEHPESFTSWFAEAYRVAKTCLL